MSFFQHGATRCFIYIIHTLLWPALAPYGLFLTSPFATSPKSGASPQVLQAGCRKLFNSVSPALKVLVLISSFTLVWLCNSLQLFIYSKYYISNPATHLFSTTRRTKHHFFLIGMSIMTFFWYLIIQYYNTNNKIRHFILSYGKLQLVFKVLNDSEGQSLSISTNTTWTPTVINDLPKLPI